MPAGLLALTLLAPTPVWAEKAKCAPLRDAIQANGKEADDIEHFLTVADMTRAATVRALSELAEVQRKIIEDLIHYGRLGCDWNRLDYAPKPR